MKNRDIATPLLEKYRINFWRLLWLALLFLILPVFFIASEMIDIERDPLLTVPFVFVPVGISLYRIYLIIANWNLEIIVAEDGFHYSNRGRNRKYTWNNIEKILTTRFELISLIYVKYIRVKIIMTSGEVLILDRTLRKVDKCEEMIQKGVAEDRLVQTLFLLRHGANFEFGDITVSKDWIKNAHDIILWSEFGDMQTWQGTFRIWKKGEQAISIMTSISTIPNIALFQYLIWYLISDAQTQPASLQEEQNERLLPPNALIKAISLAESGKATDAQPLLFEIIDSDPGNEIAWLSLASVVSRDQRIFCLEKALEINPNNLQARQLVENHDAEKTSKTPKSKSRQSIKPGGNTDARLSGLFIFILGAVLAYWQMFLPIVKALQYEPFVSYFPAASFFAPLAIFFGLFLLIFGADGLGFLSKPTSKLGLILFFALSIICILGSTLGMEFIMKSLGYD